MSHSQGCGWQVAAGMHGQMLLALYLRDLAQINPVGHPVLCPLDPPVKPAAAAEIGPHAAAELRQEWQRWWHRLLRSDGNLGSSAAAQAQELAGALDAPAFGRFNDSPTLQHLLRAHYGAAFDWTRERLEEYRGNGAVPATRGRDLVERMIQDRELEVDRAAPPFRLALLELPLAEPRAWFVEPATVILSRDLPRDEGLFRSYLQPVVDLLV
ncbi:hypothetical protein NCCP1664_02900 [Zafaria cholistanensis]|uniref:Uncharacterized protein n=1 Tax=Zafaria cholistanensis TaxID=1682741 RepID=A0A5A7NLH6_9MICC|nr:hypothetical protein [Zafaria cholistanensis]GER21793.1 hypothetical protein NCCP1664_02900 [Zafaria cholistanensis]